MQRLVTIGTDEVWAPPRMCGFALNDECVIVNTNRVWWDIFAEGWVTRWALRWNGGWCAMPLAGPTQVGPTHTPAIIEAGALAVTVDLPGEMIGVELPSALQFPLLTD